MDNQEIANGIGATVRAAEAAAAREGATETAALLSVLHDQLGQAYLAANKLGAGLDWNQVAGGATAERQTERRTAQRSGGTPKGEPTPGG